MKNDIRPASDRSGSGRYYAIVLSALGALTVTLQALALGPLRNGFWGFHLYTFLPVVVAGVSWLALLAASIDLWRPLGSLPFAGRVATILERRPLVTALVLALASCVLFWVFRSQHILLGDGHPLVTDLPRGQVFHPRQPGTMWLQQQLYQLLGGWFRVEGSAESDVAWHTVALGSVAAGFLFVLVAVAMGRSLVKGLGTDRSTSWLVILILLSQGYALLFFGYVENYSFYTVFVALYLLTALTCLQERVTTQIVVLVFLCGLLLHLSMIGLLPSLCFLVFVKLRRRETRNDALTAVVIFFVGLFVADWALRAMSPENGLAKSLRDIFDVAQTSQGGGAGVAYWFTRLHLRDFLNEQFLIGPLAAFLFLPAFVRAVYERDVLSAPAVFLSVASLSFLAGSFAMSEPLLGYARDWDLFAPAGVCYTATALYFVLTQVHNADALRPLLRFAVVFSFLQLAVWVGINHSEPRSLERFKTLPLGYGRTEVVVANWYYRHDRLSESAEWLQKALQTNPRNANAYNLLGNIYMQWRENDSALEAYRNTVVLRPDKIEFRENYVYLLLQMGRYEEAVAALYRLTEMDPTRPAYWRSLREALAALDRVDELKDVNRALLGLYETLLPGRPDDVIMMTEMGVLHGDLGEFQQALDRFREVLSRDPDNGPALFDSGSLLARLGQVDAARPYLAHFLDLYPESPMAPAARELLDLEPAHEQN